ncbi:MAG: N-acetylmuramoyl-L-alanine amidase [Candidatus Binatia bacterium]
MYQVRFYKGNYIDRQRQANEDRCAAYVEHHFNSSAEATAGYSVVIVGSNASQTSKNWGRWYAKAVAAELGTTVAGDDGILVGGYGGRGDGNLRHTTMPALLLEPLFASNPQHAAWIRSDAGQTRLARVLCESIQRFFQEGGLIGFSVGHKYKTSAPADRGAAVVGGGTEADFAEKVLLKAKAMLEGVATAPGPRTVRVMQGETLLWSGTVDEDADVSWDATRGLLRIDSVSPVAAERATPRGAPRRRR